MADNKVPIEISSLIEAAARTDTRLVILTCGLSGSGKSTLARAIVGLHPNFIRLSIDSSIFAAHGAYEIDYETKAYAWYQDEAEANVQNELTKILRDSKRDVVIDNAFYSKETRKEYMSMVRREGAGKYKVVLVVFKPSEEILWERIEERRCNEEVKEGMSIDRATLREWVKSFEWPEDDEEGQDFLNVTIC